MFFLKANFIPKRSFLLFILYVIPFGFLLWLLLNFSVNVPFWDQWELVDLFQKIFYKQATFQDFFSQHNEHRFLFPKIIISTLAFCSGWNIDWELFCNAVLGAIIFLLLFRIASEQTSKRDVIFHFTNLSTCIIVFSFCQWENWLWGFQIAWFLINGCLVTAIWILSSTLKTNLSIKVAIAAIVCFVASFSSAHGLLTWLAVIPSLAACCKDIRQFKKIGFIWGLFFLTTLFLYLFEYHDPPRNHDLWLFLKDPGLAANFFLTLLSFPLSYRSPLSSFLGFVVLANFSFFAAHCAKTVGSRFSRDAAPWLSLGCFTVLFDLLTTFGRIGLGLAQASASRYTSVNLLLLIALIQLWRLRIEQWNLAQQEHPVSDQKNILSGRRVSAGAFVITALTVLALLMSINSLSAVEGFRSRLQYGQACLDVAGYVKQLPGNCLELIYPASDAVVKRAAILNQIGFRQFPGKTIEFIAEPAKEYGFLDVPANSQTPAIARKNCLNCGPIAISGWAVLPEKRQSAKIVLLQRTGNPESETFFAYAQVNLNSPDVAKALGNQNYDQARWSTTVPANLLPLGKTVIRAWVYDPGKKQFVKLHGELALSVEE